MLYIFIFFFKSRYFYDAQMLIYSFSSASLQRYIWFLTLDLCVHLKFGT